MEFDVDWAKKDSTLVASTETQPTALLIDAHNEVLYWTEPEREAVIAFSLRKHRTITKMTYRLDPEATPSRLNSTSFGTNGGIHFLTILRYSIPSSYESSLRY